MKIAFIQNFTHEYLGVMSIAATVKQAGHEPQVFVNGLEKDLAGVVAAFNPEVIAFPVYTGSESWVFQAARYFKKNLRKIIVVGGPHATFFPEIIHQKGIDVVCRGEGEYPMVDLLNVLQEKKSVSGIPNLWTKQNKIIRKNRLRPLINPLDQLPFLNRDIYYRYTSLRKSPVKYFNIGRGCPFACAYCHNSGLTKIYQGLGQYVRNFSPQRAVEEIIQVKQKYGLKVACFVDDTFVANKVWLKEFLPLYKKQVGVPFVCNIRGNLLDEKLVRKLAGAGCRGVFMGVECGNEQMRLQLLGKTVTNNQLKRAADLLHRYDIKLSANNMVGLPEETLKEAWETIKLNRKIKTDLPWCAIFQPYPGTGMADYCLKKGLLKKGYHKIISSSFHKRSILKSADSQKLTRLHKLFHIAVWFPRATLIVEVLIRLPLTPVYEVIFLINQGLSYKRLFGLRMRDFLPLALTFTKLYFGKPATRF